MCASPAPRSVRSLLFVSLLTLGAAACNDADPFTAPGTVLPPAPTEPVPPTPPTSSEPRVAGTMVNAVAGDPIPGVVVTVGDAADTTGAAGEFELVVHNVDGATSFRAVADGFEVFERSMYVPPVRSVWLFALMPIDPSAFGAMSLYDLTAPITDHSPHEWLPMYGWYYTGILTLSRVSPGDFHVRGTITEWRENYPDGEPQLIPSCHDNVCVDNGVSLVTGTLSPDGGVVIDAAPGSWHMEGTVMPAGDLEGRWSCCGHVTGTFTAVRRLAS